MANFADRVKDTTTTTGTGSITLAGSAPTGFRTFASAYGAAANVVPYCIVGGAEWEVGYGTLSASTTLARTTVLASSNAGALVTFSAGTKDVFVTAPANALAGASASDYRANTDGIVSVNNVWSAAAEVTLTDAATITVDGSTFINAVVTLGGNRTLGTFSNPKVGQSGCIRIVQDGTGSRTLSYHADYEFAGGAAPTLTTTAGTNDLLFYQVLASGRIFCSLIKAVA